MWEDIASSIKKLDPDHADVLLASTPNCLDPGSYSNHHHHYVSSHPYNDGYDTSTMMVQHGTTIVNYDTSLENPGDENCVIVISESGDPYDMEVLPSSVTPLPSMLSMQQQQHSKSVNMSGGFVCSALDDDDPLQLSSTTRKTPPPPYQV